MKASGKSLPVCLFPGALIVTIMLGACASAPRIGSIANVAVYHTLTVKDIEAGHTRAVKESQALRAAGVSVDYVTAGRVVRVACATMSDGTWGGLGILPQGARAAINSVWRMQVLDIGSDDRDAVNTLLDSRPDMTWSGQSAYVFVPDWRELGRRTNLDPIKLPKDQDDRYEIVFSRYLIKCGG